MDVRSAFAPADGVSPMWYGYLADLLVGIHVAYVGYVVVGQLLIVIGAALRKEWARNPWFRFSHLLMMAVVAVEEMQEWRCPLTVWEEQLRQLGGQSTNGETFMGRCLHNLLFLDGQKFSESTITVLHCAFAVIVFQGLVMYPPRWFKRR